MGRKKQRRAVAATPLTPTLCPKCGSGPWSGADLRADADECPDCLKRSRDGRPQMAKFAPGRDAGLAGKPPDDQ